MSRGPKPIPSNTAASGLPQPPKWLTDEQVRLWESIVPELACSVALAPSDALALGDMMVCLHRMNAAEKAIDERGLIVPGFRGQLVKNPAASIAKSYRESFAWYAKQFGFDPRSRLRLPKSTGTESPLETARERLNRKAAETVQ